MRALKQYGGSILILIVVVVLAISFYTEALQDAGLNTIILGISFFSISVNLGSFSLKINPLYSSQ